MVGRHVDRLARRRDSGRLGARRVVDVEARDDDGAQAGVGGGDRHVLAAHELFADRAVGPDRRHVRQPVVDAGRADDVLVALQCGRLATEQPRLDELEVGQTHRHDEPDHVAVLARGDQGGVVRRLVHHRRRRRVRDVDDLQRGPGCDATSRRPGVAADHDDAVADQQQLGGEHPVEIERPAKHGLVTRDVVHREGAVVDDPHQERAVGLHHVGLVDAGLLHVGAGLARRCRLTGRLSGAPASRPRCPRACRPAGSPSRTA